MMGIALWLHLLLSASLPALSDYFFSLTEHGMSALGRQIAHHGHRIHL